jgi:hypothetical protein
VLVSIARSSKGMSIPRRRRAWSACCAHRTANILNPNDDEESRVVQKRQLMDIVGAFISYLPVGPLAARLAQVEASLERTWSWIGKDLLNQHHAQVHPGHAPGQG